MGDGGATVRGKGRLRRDGLRTVAATLFLGLAASTSLAASGAPGGFVQIAGPPGEASGSADLAHVVCPSLAECVAVGGAVEATFDPRRPGRPAAVTLAAGSALEGVACPSATQCTAVGGPAGKESGPGSSVVPAGAAEREFTFDPRTPAKSTSVELAPTEGPTGTAFLEGVACPSTTQCTAVGQIETKSLADTTPEEVTFDPRGPNAPALTALAPVTADVGVLSSVACPSTRQCTATQDGGHEVTFSPLAPGAPKFTSDRGATAFGTSGSSVACPSARQCTATFGAWQAATFDPVDPGTPQLARIPHLASDTVLLSLACPSARLCVAVGFSEPLTGPGSTVQSGRVVTFRPATPSRAVVATIPPHTGLSAVACPSVTQCTAIDFGRGREVTFDPSRLPR